MPEPLVQHCFPLSPVWLRRKEQLVDEEVWGKKTGGRQERGIWEARSWGALRDVMR